MFWTGEKRKFVRKFYSQIKQRAAFAQGVNHVGLLDPPSLDMSRFVSRVVHKYQQSAAKGAARTTVKNVSCEGFPFFLFKN